MTSRRPRVAVVVGCGGMGLAGARRMVGHHLLLADRDPRALEVGAAALVAAGRSASVQPVDVTDPQSVSHLAQVAAGLGDVTALLHTAGVSPVQASARRILEVDLLGTVHVIDAFQEALAPGGAAVLIASMAGHLLGALEPGQESDLTRLPADQLLAQEWLSTPDVLGNPALAYMIAKRGNHLRVRASALTWGRRGCRVNTVSPGVIGTDMGAAELDGPNGEAMRHLVEESPLARVGTAEEIADAVEFLLSSRAAFITGTDLLVDGGVVASVQPR